MTPRVSVIIPCYRQGRFLAGVINDLLTQTYTNIEIVVVNDGSDDDTEAVAREFGQQIVYVVKANGGLASARNAGIRAATGEYLYFLDADDSLHPSAISWLVETAAAGGGCIAMMGYRVFERRGDWIAGEDAPAGASLFPWLLVRNYPVHSYLVPRNLALTVSGFDESMVTYEDHDFWIRIATVSPAMRTVGERGAYYRQHAGSMSRNRVCMGRGRIRLLTKTTKAVANDATLATDHGSLFLRHLYVCRLIVAAQAPDLDRVDLDHCIMALRRAGIRCGRKSFDWCYALVPKPLLPITDRVMLGLLRWVMPGKYAELKTK